MAKQQRRSSGNQAQGKERRQRAESQARVIRAGLRDPKKREALRHAMGGDLFQIEMFRR